MLGNFNLFAIGLVTAITAILGLIVLMNDRKNATHRAFSMFALWTVLYSAANYAQGEILDSSIALWVLRLTIFFAVWHAFSFFHLFYVFPKSDVKLPRWYRYVLFPGTVLVSLVNLTPLVFNHIAEISPEGTIAKIANGPAIGLFSLAVLFFVIGGIIILFRKLVRAKDVERAQFEIIAIGTVLTFFLLLIFNFIFPAFVGDADFVVLAPVFLFPFIVASAYAIIRYRLFDVRLVGAQIFTFALAMVTLIETVVSPGNTVAIILRIFLFPMVLGIGVLLIRSVQKEVEQREELARLNAFKTQLLSIASHQIKSPLAAIKGFASILLQGLYGPIEGPVRETIQKMEHASNSLIALINDLLDFRRVEEGKIEYNLTAVNLCDLTQHVVDLLEPLAKEKGIALSFDRPHVPLVVSADPQKLQEVVQNLVDNAVKYTLKGQVTVTLVREDKSALLAVKDSGVGISAELLPHLFAEFVRDENIKRQIRGTGLGLYIARKLIEGQQGTIWAESAGEGSGSQFFVRLPLG